MFALFLITALSPLQCSLGLHTKWCSAHVSALEVLHIQKEQVLLWWSNPVPQVVWSGSALPNRYDLLS